MNTECKEFFSLYHQKLHEFINVTQKAEKKAP
jgi:hypothetical protein